MAPAEAGGIRVLRTTRVAPAPPAGKPELPERALPLLFLDAMWLRALPVERVFFYRLGPDDDDVDAVLSRLVESLPRALHAFYPLAGRVHLTPGVTNRYELHYQPGDGVALTVAELDGVEGVDELATDEPRELAKITRLVPEIPKGGAVVALQATVLPPLRRGLAIGVAVHHSACDGVGSTHFLHTWAAACAGDWPKPPEPPVIDRTLIRDRKDMHDSFVSPDNEAKVLLTSPDVGKLVASFTLSRAHLQSVKDAVAAETARRGVPPFRCTSTDATYGLIWLCFQRAGAESVAAEKDDGRVAHGVFAVDHRSHLEPRVPDKYFGNCIGPAFPAAPKKDLTAGTIADGVFTACAAVAAAVDEAVRAEPLYWERWGERIVEACVEDDMAFSVAGSPRFRVYDVDFGFGWPAKVEVVSVARTGAMSVPECRGLLSGVLNH
uniref:Uncharacterized protein n=1 Tax=Leersia perrieri TaxID=77586 RepID=A0A0D9V0U5_9ORYZ